MFYGGPEGPCQLPINMLLCTDLFKVLFIFYVPSYSQSNYQDTSRGILRLLSPAT